MDSFQLAIAVTYDAHHWRREVNPPLMLVSVRVAISLI